MTENEERAARRGRPSASSRETLEEAALELFLEQGYEQTSASDIARRAGVARSPFFNYFTAKADVLWVGLDPLLAGIPSVLDAAAADLADAGLSEQAGRAEVGAGGAGLAELRRVLLAISETVRPEHIPWAASLREMTGTGDDLAATGSKRMLAQQAALVRYLARTEPELDALQRSVCAGAIVAAVVAAGSVWIEAGPTRGSLAELVDKATAPILEAYARE